MDMSSIRLVNHACFLDPECRLLTAGIDGCFSFEFHYKGKYLPAQAAVLDPEGKTIEIELRKKEGLQGMQLWLKGLKVDRKNEVIISWNSQTLCFN